MGRLSMSQLRALVRERLTNAWASGDLQKAVQEASVSGLLTGQYEQAEFPDIC